MTFKEDCPDVRNSRSYDVYEEFRKCGLSPKMVDPCADKEEVSRLYGLELTPLKLFMMRTALFLVQHEVFRKLQIDEAASLFRRPKPGQKQVLIDVKGMFERKAFEEKGFLYWSL